MVFDCFFRVGVLEFILGVLIGRVGGGRSFLDWFLGRVDKVRFFVYGRSFFFEFDGRRREFYVFVMREVV